MCAVFIIQALAVIAIPVIICRYISQHDDSFCNVFTSRARGLFKYLGKELCDFYYPIAVIEEEDEPYTQEVDTKERAQSNQEFNNKQKIEAFIEEK